MFELKLEKKELPFAMAEEIKNLRTGITFSGADIKAILFTSSTPNEGKSTISLELARSFAELGKKVVYLDCDLRKSIFNCKIREGKIVSGLSHYLTGQSKIEDIIYENDPGDDDVKFYVIPSGPSSNSPTELLSSDLFDKLLEKLREDYDMVIVDAPPLGSVVDASIVSSKVDGTVIVVEAGNINYKAIQKVRDKLDASGAKILGVVLNKVDKSRKSYGYYKYGKDYGYGYGYGKG
ncbi:CpsD/CapB family tyrosine-protein kinase [Butyrivibrio sp. MC2021]|uniref:CpsD/CapB family tyrosine-protein kinase n=1 Tax=Butyrivibrio sp. MC2021 TaxID=1408306 RepID=UPI00047C8159|nr:CpsD/CapB family tyrosine-protein kinase [Butyrivibrio sp. MC2021]